MIIAMGSRVATEIAIGSFVQANLDAKFKHHIRIRTCSNSTQYLGLCMNWI